MRIEIAKNKVFLRLTKKKMEIHPLWLRERARLNSIHDKNTEMTFQKGIFTRICLLDIKI